MAPRSPRADNSFAMSPRHQLSRPLGALGLGAIVALLVVPANAYADAGVPMLALMAVPMWASLLVIIPLEALVATRGLGTSWGRSLKVAAVANLGSTVVGVPLTWLVLAAAEIGLQYAGSLLAPQPGPTHPLSPL